MNRPAIFPGRLPLTTPQQEQTGRIFDEHEAAPKLLIEQAKQATVGLSAALRTTASAAEIGQFVRNMANLSGENLDIDTKVQSKIYVQVLTEQNLKVEQSSTPSFAASVALLPPGFVIIATAGGHK